MADVKWIKITTDMFDNRKIKHLRRLPDGNNIVLIWVMLLTMAGRCNAGGMIFLTENIPYTPKMLADELGFEENTVKLAINALEQLNMIVSDNGVFSIAGWDEHQNVDGMEKVRELGKIRQAKFKERKKLLSGNVSGNVTDNVTVTLGNALDIDEERDIRNTLVNKSVIGEKPTHFIPPSVDEVRTYCTERGNGVDAERFVDYYTARGWLAGKSKMKDWKAAVRTWERNDREDRHGSTDTGEAAADVPERGQYGTWL